MKLSSALALKQELLNRPAKLAEHAATTATFQAFSARRETAQRALQDIALGVSPKSARDYRLAVRPQRSGPLISAIVEEINRGAKGEIDVKYIGNIVKLGKSRGTTEERPTFYRARHRPLRIGASISDVHPRFASAGTLGCFVVRRKSPHYIGVLSNNHVLANENRNQIGDPIVQPGALDGGRESVDQVGELGRFVQLRTTSVNVVDAAVGDLFDEVEFDSRQVGSLGYLRGIETVANLPEKAKVFKVGRTTGQTEGRITAFAVDNVHVEFDMGVLRFDNQIEIEGVHSRAFSDSGDSGSLIVDSALRAVGLLFAGGDEGGSNGRGLTYANPIEAVLDRLQVDLEL